MSAIIDIFNCVQHTYDEKSLPIDILSLIDEIFNNPTNKINWDKYLHIFYTNKYKFGSSYPKNIQNNIKKILSNKNSDIHNFVVLDNIFKNLNDLNLSYNQSINKINYTNSRLQDNYIEYILTSDNTDLLNHWFRGISNNITLELYDGVPIISKYHRTIMILRKYLRLQYKSYDEYNKRNSNIGNFYIKYSDFIADELINNYTCNKMSISNIFSKLQEIEKKNEIFMDNMNFGKNIFSKNIIYKLIVHCWQSHVNTNIIDESFLNCINSISLQNHPMLHMKYNYINNQFINKWYLDIKDKINPLYFKNSVLFNDIIKVLPILKYNKGFYYNEKIDTCFRKLFDINNEFLQYIVSKLDVIILSHNTIKAILSLIALYENKNTLWEVYFKNLYNRLHKYGCSPDAFDNYINNEYLMFNYLINIKNNNTDSEYLNKTRIMLDNFANSIKHNKNLRTCKIDFVDNLNNNFDIDKNIFNKVNYIVFDKNIIDNTNSYQLIDKNKYFHQFINKNKYFYELNMPLKFGENYYKNVSDIYNYEWDIQRSVIDFTINSTRVSSSIIEYIIIKTIMEDSYNLDKFFDQIINKEYNTSAFELIMWRVAKKMQQRRQANVSSPDITQANVSSPDITQANVSSLDMMYANVTSVDMMYAFEKGAVFKKYLSSYVKNLISVNLITYNDNVLSISKNIESNHIDIVSFVPYIVDLNSVNNLNESSEEKKLDKENLYMNKECIVYLRSLFLTKIFKRNSTKFFNIEKIIIELKNFVDDELSSKKYSNELINIFKHLVTVPENILINELESLEKRNIIEIKKGGINLRFYKYFI